MNPPTIESTSECDVSSFNRKLLELWSETAVHELPTKRCPLIYPSMRKGCLLFVGLNPSYTVSGDSFMLEGKEYSFDKHFRWNEKTFKEEFLEKELNRLRSKEIIYSAPYFTPLTQIAQNCGLHFEHIDLFAVRETKQGVLRKSLEIEEVKGGGMRISDFAQRQIDIAFELMTKLEPKLIMVVNALAARLFLTECERSGRLMIFNDERGYHVTTSDFRQVPVFFSGMLSGQRALDRFSRERLSWHAKRAISISNKAEDYHN